ncbi:hypothetical protein CRG98_018712 [Punica granatum]|uniref:Uncharacterized protein n=1 Tax=Punica granatum TaxID=22663 RepID=A0A2I0JX50_PUNGR|nr:hypothetical protein CRG98_018712 [Punica granatum]
MVKSYVGMFDQCRQAVLLLCIQFFVHSNSKKIKWEGEVGTANRRPSVPTPNQSGIVGGPRSIRGWGLQSATPTPPPSLPVPTEDADYLGGGVGVVNWRPQPRIDQAPSTRSPRLIRDWGHQSVTPTPPPRLPTFSMGTGDLDGGIGVADWRSRPLLPFLFSLYD